MIKSWSHSREQNFQKCRLRSKLMYIDKIEEPRAPLKEGLLEYPNDRGNRVHEAAELYVKGGVELIPELATNFTAEFEELRALYAQGKVSLEGEWAHDEAWLPCAWRSETAWLRLKIDALVMISPEHALVIDYKTGKRFGNELKHAEQTQLYTLCTLMRYPQVKRVTTELWYPDQDDLARAEYTREQGLRFLRSWSKRGLEITTATEFPANPNIYSCRYCMYGPKGSGVCTQGV